MAQRKYVSLSKLSIFLDNLKTVFASKENMDVLEGVVDTKANIEHLHNISEVENLPSTIEEINNNISQKSQVQMITSDNADSMTEVLSTLKIHKLSQEQYDEALSNGVLDENAIYLTPDEEIDLSPYATIEQLNGKADVEHSHNGMYYTKSETDDKVAQRTQVQIITWEVDD